MILFFPKWNYSKSYIKCTNFWLHSFSRVKKLYFAYTSFCEWQVFENFARQIFANSENEKSFANVSPFCGVGA